VALLRGKKKAGEAADSGRSEKSDARREALALVIAYAKQETLEPLKALLRFVIFGTLGSFAIALGTVLVLVGVLRVLQSETGAFHGNLSWLPYVIVAAVAVVVIAGAASRIMAGPAARRLPEKKSNG
jgi:hypothetical protein